MEQKDYITFSELLCQVSGLTNYPLAYLALGSMTNIGASCILFEVLKYIRKKYSLEKKFFRTLGEKLEFGRELLIPYPVYELTYLFKDECDKKSAKDFCEPLKEFQPTFSLYETDVLDGKCKLKIDAVENKIKQVLFIYDYQNSNAK